ncbi:MULTISPECIES: transcriptional regulator [Rhizorhabdus]|uniref:DNA-binding transcriptional regulator YdaS, prophage-encoded, Cro superfamily n=2 Tax=Rhizorhabdus TaxID=1649486 RepID=A0A1T5BN37_9SPHN|nr:MULTISPECIES: YdaS family helix-turn-helix protein [Rhizorhabdus]ARR53465.1 hypothetical protein HY78_08530 [Rhizorhabdus wittichii DC-6]QTH19759.1 helix-turn-helix domain-containing protein [Rhizorhabdus wittichii]SKB48654.1 DNA-binding transcriptional regulator YdaS, prophage-encoded, Cro superfamily [Rhizorhabdus histidinilytica]
MAKLMTPHAAFAKAVEAAGGQTNFAKICGCTQGNIWQLLKKGAALPPQYVLKVEAAALGVDRHQLRPDIYPSEAPEGAAA